MAYRPEVDKTEWNPWFAWHPVKLEKTWVWLETIERKLEFFSHMDGYDITPHYRDANQGRGRYPAGWP